jgi:hypothetical protein
MPIDLKRCVVYDVEVAIEPENVPGGWDNPEGMGFASAVTYSYEDDQYRFWLGALQQRDLCHFLSGKTAVTFNGVKFDSRVLLGNDRVCEGDLTYCVHIPECAWHNCDLLLEYVRERFNDADVAAAEKRLGDKTIHDGTFGLDGLAEGTLHRRKTGHGAHAPMLYRTGNYAELLAYNLQDVRLTKELFNFIRKFGYCVDRAGRRVLMEL